MGVTDQLHVWLFYPWVKVPHYQLDGKMRGPKARVGLHGDFFPLVGIKHQFLGLSSSHYTKQTHYTCKTEIWVQLLHYQFYLHYLLVGASTLSW